VLINLSHRHRTHLKETTLTAVRSFQNALNGKFPPSPDSRPSQPTGYVIYPTLGTDLADTASGKKKPADAESLGKSLAKSASASADAIQKLNVTQLIPESADYGPVASVHGVGATRLEMTAAQGLIVHAFRIYSSIGGLMEQAGQATSDKDRTALVNDAKELLTQAQALFNEGYQKITNVMGELSALQANPFPQQGGGLGG